MTRQEAIAKIIEMWDTVEFDRCGSPGERAAHKQELKDVLAALDTDDVFSQFAPERLRERAREYLIHGGMRPNEICEADIDRVIEDA